MYLCMAITFSRVMINRVRLPQLNRENEFFPVPVHA